MGPIYHFFPYITSLHSFSNLYKSISASQGNFCPISIHFNFGKMKSYQIDFPLTLLVVSELLFGNLTNTGHVKCYFYYQKRNPQGSGDHYAVHLDDFLLKCPFKSGPGLVLIAALTPRAHRSALRAHTQYQTSLCTHRCC